MKFGLARLRCPDGTPVQRSLGVASLVALLVFASPANADVLLGAPAKQIAAGQPIKLGVWDRDQDTDPNVTVQIYNGAALIATRSLEASPEWRSYVLATPDRPGIWTLRVSGDGWDDYTYTIRVLSAVKPKLSAFKSSLRGVGPVGPRYHVVVTARLRACASRGALTVRIRERKYSAGRYFPSSLGGSVLDSGDAARRTPSNGA